MNNGNSKILIIDDEEKIRKLLKKILEETPHEVDEAENGLEALETISKKKYDLMIVDLNMPKMNGQTLISKVRQTDNYAAFIILTAHGDLETAYGLLNEYRISDFLTKPLNSPLQLLFSVENALEKQRLQKQNVDYNQKLEDSLAKVKLLSGLLPICCNCKKIRDDKGYWNQIEGYIKDHSEADFSHGICPECSKKLYPQLFTNRK